MKKVGAGGIGVRKFDAEGHLAIRHTVGAAIGRPPVTVGVNHGNSEQCGKQELSSDAKDSDITDCILRTRNARPYFSILRRAV